MKKSICCALFLLSSFVSFSQCPEYDAMKVKTFRNHKKIETGNVKIIGDYAGSYTVVLFHPDAPGTAFKTWKFSAKEEAFLMHEGKKMVIGNDWGVQIIFENNARSCVGFVGNVTSLKDGTFVIKTTTIYNLKEEKTGSESVPKR